MQIIILVAGTEAAGGGNFGKSWGWWTATAGERAMGKSTSHCGTFRISIALRELIDAHKSVELAPGKGREIVGERKSGKCEIKWENQEAGNATLYACEITAVEN